MRRRTIKAILVTGTLPKKVIRVRKARCPLLAAFSRFSLAASGVQRPLAAGLDRVREGEPSLRKAAASGRISRPLGLSAAQSAALHTRPTWQVARRGRAIACRRPMRLSRRVRTVMALTPPCATSAVGAAAGTLTITGAAPASAAAPPPPSGRPSVIPPWP